MGQKGYNYFRIPTVAGNFYLYREYDNNTEIDYISYGPLREFFTGVTCGTHLENDTLDLNKQKDKLKFEMIRSELEKRGVDVDYLLSYTSYIDYNYIRFHGNHTFKSYPAFNYNSYDLFKGNAEFVIEDVPAEFGREPYFSPDYKRYQIAPTEFAERIKNLIDKYGSMDKVKEIMLARIVAKAEETERQNEYIRNKLNENTKANDEAEAYIKKLLKEKN